MGFCGCSLGASAVTAVVLGLVQSIFGLSWNILVIVLMSEKSVDEPSAAANATTETPTDDYYASTDDYNATDLWSVLSDNIKSQRAVQEHMYEIVMAALVLNALWLISTLALAVGNAEKCRNMLKPWIGITVIVTITDIAATIFFIFKAVKEDEIFDIRTSFFTQLYVFYAFMFSRGGPLLWIINVALCVFVAQRAKEIQVSKRMPFGSDYHITPYTLNPPYDAFETESSTRTSKAPRPPHTPPPDYEGPQGKKRRNSLTSEPETMTLPISSRGSQRPLSQSSYLYDDRVELQHRASCAAETVLHHAYVNKGLVMDSEGWMGECAGNSPHNANPTE